MSPQTQAPTNFSYNLCAGLLYANTFYVAMDNGVMTAYGANTNTMTNEVNTNGFGRQAGTKTVINTNATLMDTAQIFYLYTANSNITLNGHCIVNNATNGNGNYNMLAWCQYATTLSVQNTDTVNCITQFQFLLGV